MRIASFSLFLVIGLLNSAYSQEKCGTVPYMQKLKSLKRFPSNDQVFEDWIQGKILQRRDRLKNQRTKALYQVPVVVHVIHNGEAIGTGTNISDAQVLSQIKVLNDDYQRQNTDKSNTPALFLPVAGQMDIEFVLAKQDPEGLATNGIVRVHGSRNGWTSNDNYEIKSQSYWPSEDYLNIWVCDLVDDLVGYAQFPESDEPGLEGSSQNALTDGVVIWHKAFGSAADGPFDLSSNFNRGRTATHEIAHFFGLNHIWGDDSGSCSGTDNVADTPNQAGSSSGCPSHPRSSCSTTNMFQNYMDYTNDVCMNLFTAGQVNRMETVIENSPRRESLLTSHGLLVPGEKLLDLGIREIENLSQFRCNDQLQPQLLIRNYGNNTVTSARIRFELNGVTQETKDFTLNLTKLVETVVTFSEISAPVGNATITFEIILVNGVGDGDASNNIVTENIVVPTTVLPPFSENFNTFPVGWSIQNPDGLKTWQLVTAPKESSANKAIHIDIFNYDESSGEVDFLVSPLIDLTQATIAALEFYLAHSKYPNSNDRLRVILMQDCEDIGSGTVIYEKGGSTLATTASSDDEFVPQNESDWRKEFVDLNDYVGSKIQLAFVAVSDYGNNIYLDNIGLITSQYEDVALSALQTPAIVTCNPNPSPTLLVQNIGTEQITNLKVSYSVNGGNSQTVQFTDLALNRGEEALLQIPDADLAEGVNEIAFTLSEPNGQTDQSPSNNTKTFTIIVNESEDRIPLRENFETDFDDRWVVTNPSGGQTWQSTTTNFGNSLFVPAFSNTTIGEEAWLVSPVLDFSGATTASMVFDISQRQRLEQEEQIRIVVSLDCGETFSPFSTLALNPQEFATSWKPASANDWVTNYVVELNDLAGESAVRIAFVVTNANGNNVYLDNIEFFTTDQPNLLAIAEEFFIYGYNFEDPSLTDLKITFNLDVRQDVNFTIVDMMGHILVDGMLHDVLNQTFSLETEEKNLKQGVYIIKLHYDGKIRTHRILLPG
jgi:hypothetical protein